MRKTWNERIHMGRRIRRLAAGLSGLALAVLLGVLLQFVKNWQFDAAGCTILACNTAILPSCASAYLKCRKYAAHEA